MSVGPGPSDYLAHTVMVNTTAAQLVRNAKKTQIIFQKPKTEQTPGPADYKIDFVKQKYLIGKRNVFEKDKKDTRDSFRKQDFPGPASYNTRPEKFSKGNISMKSRFSPFVMVFPSMRMNTLNVQC
jgi:hypothetical protein